MLRRLLILLLSGLYVLHSVGFTGLVTQSELPDYGSNHYFASHSTLTKRVYVSQFGAVGNGISDDTLAIQKAIDYGKAQKAIVTFEADQVYKISDNLFLHDYTQLDGRNATIYMPAQNEMKSMFISTYRDYIKEVVFYDMNFSSDLAIEGSGYNVGKQVSQVQGIYVSGIDGLIIEDVHFDGLDTAIKFGDPHQGKVNQNIVINRFSIANASTGMYVMHTNDLKVSNGFVDINGGSDQRLHDVYLAGANTGIVFDNVTFLNSPGAGINIYSGHSDISPSSQIEIANCFFYNCKRGVNIWSGATGVTMDKIRVMQCSLAVSMDHASDVTCQDIRILDAKHVGVDKGAFMLENASDVTFCDVEVDCDGMEGYLFLFKNQVTNVSIRDTLGKNIEGVSVFYANTPSMDMVSNITVESSLFDYKPEWKRDLEYNTLWTLY